MTEAEKITRVKTLLQNDPTATSEIVEEYLHMAEDRILSIMYQFDFPEDPVIPRKYENLQCELAARYFARRGGLGEIAHSENGTQRSWQSVDDNDILRKIRPILKAV